MDADTDEDYLQYLEELQRHPEYSPIHSSQAFAQRLSDDSPSHSSDARSQPSFDLSGVWLSPMVRVSRVPHWSLVNKVVKISQISRAKPIRLVPFIRLNGRDFASKPGSFKIRAKWVLPLMGTRTWGIFPMGTGMWSKIPPSRAQGPERGSPSPSQKFPEGF
ncbi:hypothetical protein PIB30_028215 [Stylosanthes scabra]|uniref:Uncharacterized protein n=1 Tax=Stylosanthes scabra TaxID=79078 RepID=A0ABU6TAN6_9FABA|nr:hypothetical protein [Stylosanthes scabra]